MIILGLGSNQSRRLQNLREAIRLLRTISGLEIHAVSPVYQSDAMLPEGASVEWHKAFYNCAVSCETHHSPFELL